MRKERIKTPISATQAAALLQRHMRPQHGIEPKAGPLLLAQVWLETARGQSMIQHNWGNITGTFRGDYWEPPWVHVSPDSSERDRRLNALMLEGKAPSQFRAYPDHETGLHDYLSFLTKTRFEPIVDAAEAGDPDAMAVQIQRTGYCPDCQPGPTANTLRQLAVGFEPLFPKTVIDTIMKRPVGLAKPLIVYGVGALLVAGVVGYLFVRERWQEVKTNAV